MPSWMACCSSEVGFCKQPNGLVLHCSDYENSWIMPALLLTTTSPGPFTHNKEIGFSAFSIFSPVSYLYLQWGIVDAEITIPSAKNTGLTNVLPFK